MDFHDVLKTCPSATKYASDASIKAYAPIFGNTTDFAPGFSFAASGIALGHHGIIGAEERYSTATGYATVDVRCPALLFR